MALLAEVENKGFIDWFMKEDMCLGDTCVFCSSKVPTVLFLVSSSVIKSGRQVQQSISLIESLILYYFPFISTSALSPFYLACFCLLSHQNVQFRRKAHDAELSRQWPLSAMPLMLCTHLPISIAAAVTTHICHNKSMTDALKSLCTVEIDNRMIPGGDMGDKPPTVGDSGASVQKHVPPPTFRYR